MHRQLSSSCRCRDAPAAPPGLEAAARQHERRLAAQRTQELQLLSVDSFRGPLPPPLPVWKAQLSSV